MIYVLFLLFAQQLSKKGLWHTRLSRGANGLISHGSLLNLCFSDAGTCSSVMQGCLTYFILQHLILSSSI